MRRNKAVIAENGRLVDESATVIGIDKEVLVKALKSGKSIVEAAADKGINEADLTAKLQQLRTGKIEAAVKDGKLTADQGEHMKMKLSEHLKFILNEKNLLDAHDGRGKWHKFGLKPDTEKLAKTLESEHGRTSRPAPLRQIAGRDCPV